MLVSPRIILRLEFKVDMFLKAGKFFKRWSLRNARFLMAENLKFRLNFLGGKNEEILVGFVVTGAGHGLQCIGLRGRCKVQRLFLCCWYLLR
jgi:hypothetical protein